MQSLILATSLALSTPATISSFDNTLILDEMVNAQVSAVATMVSYQTKVSTQDTFLYQAKLAINSASVGLERDSAQEEQAAE